MGTSPLYDLLFESAGDTTIAPRIPLNEDNRRRMQRYAREARDTFQSTVDLITVLNSAARKREVPSHDLESFTAQVVDELHQFVRALNEFSDYAEDRSAT